jgi:hypothetical protein
MARDCAFSTDGRSLFLSWASDSLAIHDAVTGKQQHAIPVNDPKRPDTYQSILSTHLSDDGKLLIAFSHYYATGQAGLRYQDTLITGWDAATRKQLFQRRRPVMESWLALSADVRVLAASQSTNPRIAKLGFAKAAMLLEDVRTGKNLLTFPRLEGQTWPVAFCGDGRLLASSNCYRPPPDKVGKPAPERNTLRLWETMTAAEVLSFPSTNFLRAAFSPDGRLLAMTAPVQEILVWDLARGRELRRFKGFDSEVTYLTFSPDGRRLVSSLADSTLLVWDVGPRDTTLAKLDTDGQAKAWDDLASTDAPRAFRARGALASSPDEALPLLKQHLRPAEPADAQRLRRLLADLESEQFAVREKAQTELQELGDLAEPALRQALEGKPSLELRRRVQAVLEHLRGPVTQPEMLRSLRAVAVLEDIATPEARRLLEELAAGAAEARLTREAKAALRRLQ